MKKRNNFFLRTIFIIFLFFTNNIESKEISIGKPDSKVIVKVFSSLTCPHCANFHEKIYEKLKIDYIDKGLVRFEHHGFPLDMAALNAEIIIRCNVDDKKSFQLLSEIYKKQNKWAVGSDINKINESIKKIGNRSGLSEKNMNICLNDEAMQDKILNERIEAQKKYEIQSTPTIYVNEKQFKDKHEYEFLKKTIENLL